jgi:hypothetical protein
MADVNDFDGCSRVCHEAGVHTLTWGTCENATEPEPRLAVARHVIADDGWPSIAMESIPLAELADRIERALRSAPAGEYSAMALAAAKALTTDPDAKEA